MKMTEFKLERLFAHYGPKAKHLLSATACESCSMNEVLEMADDECKKLWENLDLGYTDYRGHLKLREAITERYKTLGPDDILEVIPEEGIYILMNVMLDEGDEVIAIQPTLPSLHEIPRALGCTVIPWQLEMTDWGWRLDMDFLARTISSKTKMIILNIPNNPTGYVPVLTDLMRVASFAEKFGVWIFSEETYRGMEHDPGAELPSVVDLSPRAVALGGINKLGLAGSRVGWLASQNRSIIAKCLAYKDYTSLCPSASSEILALIAMRNFRTLIARSHKIILENLDLAQGFFASKPEWFQWTEPNGGSTAFPKLLSPFKVSELCDKAMEDAQILIVPDRAFGISQNRFRLGFGKRDFGHALADFMDFMEKYTAQKDQKDTKNQETMKEAEKTK